VAKGETVQELEQQRKKSQVIDQVAEWIDTQVIAEMIVDHVYSLGEEVTFERCKEVWCGTLQNLGGGVGLAL